ncbi:MAG: N-acetylglucosamine-6-phosphate deacetylase [Pseudobutyrivibrio sp.]|nr:N-acetylglucosamine-6-phosphate deacetylase [Pseudobutyrivibrio sp.]
MKITNVKIYKNGSFETGEIGIENDRFTTPAADDSNVIDGGGLMAIPGLCDLHFHGAVGADISDGDVEGVKKMVAYEHSHGITTVNPATMTLSEEQLIKAVRSAVEAGGVDGIYLEGPFISPNKVGAQNPDYVKNPDGPMLKRIMDAADGLVDFCALAPETQGAIEFIKEFKDQIGISVAHTTADFDTAQAAFDAGAKQITHMYNAMPPLHHRSPGVIGAASDSSHVSAEIICDGVHIHPSAIRAAFRLFGPERMIFISDTMRAVGLKDGEYTLGGQAVIKEGPLATLKGSDTIAGSATNLYDCMKFAVQQVGIPLTDAIRCASENPAKAIGKFDQVGSIDIGKRADLLLVDSDLNLKKIFAAGVEVPVGE